MDAVIRGVTIYLLLLLIFRLSGKRTLAQASPFDLVLALIISESIQQAMLNNDDSMTNGLLLVITLVGLDIVLSLAKRLSPHIGQVIDGAPLVVVQNGRVHWKYMARERIDETEVVQAAREHHGLRTLEEVDSAVLEASGQITIIPRRKD